MKMIFSVLVAISTGAVFAASNPLIGRLEGVGFEPPEGYAAPLISNGDLNMLVEWMGGQTGVKRNEMIAEVYWQGRRGPAREAALFSFGRFMPEMRVNGADALLPARWAQTLDIKSAIVECEGEFECGVKATTKVFCAIDRNVVAIRRTVKNVSQEKKKVELDLKYILQPHERLSGSWCNKDLYFTRSPYERMRGKWAEPNTDVKRTFHGLTYGHEVIGFDIDVVSCDGGMICREFELDAGKSCTVDWFIVYSDTFEERRTVMPECSWDDLFALHSKLWSEYYAESFVRIPDAQMQRMYDVQQYHLRCNATRWGFPVGIFPYHWQGKYFGFDEMYMHDGLISAGHFDIARRSPEWRYRVMHRALSRQSHYSARGKYGARWMWMSLEDGEVETAGVGFWLDHIFAMGTIARSAWTQYTYSGDVGYLKKIGYPIILECARFYRNNWIIEESAGVARIGRCTDLERLGPSRDRAFLTTCSAIYTLRIAADAAAVLGVDKDECADFRAAAERLVNGLPRSLDKTRYIAYEGCTEDSVGTLGGLYPFPIFGPKDALQVEAARHFISVGRAAGNMYPMGNKVCPWYAAKMSAAMTVLGDRREPFRWLSEAAGAIGAFGETWEINEPRVRFHPWFATASGNSVFAVNEMLLKGTVPESWKDYAFSLPDGEGNWVDCEFKDGKCIKRNVKRLQP